MTDAMVLLATRSEGKLRELRPLFAAAGVGVQDLREAGLASSPEEDAVEAFQPDGDDGDTQAGGNHRGAGLEAADLALLGPPPFRVDEDRVTPAD